MDYEMVQKLVPGDGNLQMLRSALTPALTRAAKYLGLATAQTPLELGCAATLSALLDGSGIELGMESGAGNLVRKLKKRGWTMIAVGQQVPGDVGVTVDNTLPVGADHLYLVAQLVSSDTVLVADNQESNLHTRNVGPGERTRTEYFLRAPMLAASSTSELGVDPTTAHVIINSVDRLTELRQYSWIGRGRAPLAYLRGMAVGYAHVYQRLSTDPVVQSMARPPGDAKHDALAYYKDQFAAAGIATGEDPATTLRALFVLLIGLGMRESSGKHCEGRYVESATSNTAEAGLFQSSYDLMLHDDAASYGPIIERYAASTLLLDIFSDQVHCDPEAAKNVGTGINGIAFQAHSKQCPAFAIEIAALGLRQRRGHWGPINDGDVEVLVMCDNMLQTVQWIVD
ncbi:hypothetical protein O0881_02465 [Janthinobacterium sp. SUN100]|uniref:hypothetical protein n=1 Tax=Janthinobacterium sp. SUN100 TaxID=3004101 RepID=UPI0025B0F176|nr:hypothetical protein [Janthinobacterium sp. SUN100]MDN2700854.1 hypothetical protein [Janthinobacterium sp. SUN100]